MKLKKIASLALAGVMAVSMLTACGSSTTNEQPPVDNGGDTTPAAGYSATFENRLSDRGNANISMSDSADLNAALQFAMNFAADRHIAADYDDNYGHMAWFIGTNYNTDLSQVAKELVKQADDKQESMKNSVADVMDVLNPNNTPNKYADDDLDVVMLFGVDGGLSTDAAVMEVADLLDEEMKMLVRNYNTSDSNGSTIENVYSYTGSVSADTITLDADHGKSLTFVAVEIVRELA